MLENKNPHKVREIAGASHGGKGEKASMLEEYDYTGKSKKKIKNPQTVSRLWASMDGPHHAAAWSSRGLNAIILIIQKG